MMVMYHSFIVLCLALILHVGGIRSHCTPKSGEDGIISQNFTVTGNGLYMHCWKILNPFRKPIRLQVRQFNFYGKPCGVGDLRILAEADAIDESFCGHDTDRPGLVASSDVEVRIFINAHYYSSPNNKPNFEVHFEMEGNRSRTSGHECTKIANKKGMISRNYTLTGHGFYRHCWKITNTEKNNIRLEVRQFNFYNKRCSQANLTIADEWDDEKDTGLDEMFCGDLINKGILISNTDIEVNVLIDESQFSTPFNFPSFEIYFEIVAIKPECCTDIFDETGIISGNYQVAGSGFFWHCWHILNPFEHNIHLQIQHYNFYNKPCGVADLRIVSLPGGEEETICGNYTSKHLISRSNDLVFIMFINAHYFSKPNNSPNFQIHFEMDAEEEKNLLE